MASRRFFGYDPYNDDDYYYPAPYRYAYPYHQPAPARGAGGFFPAPVGDVDGYYRYQHQPVVSRNRSDNGFFPAAADFEPYYQPAPARGFFPSTGNRNVQPAVAARGPLRPEAGVSRPVSEIPVRFVKSDPEPEVARTPVKPAPSAEAAAVRLQAAARGFLARKAVRALRAVEREAEGVAEKVAREADALLGDARARIAVGEELMRLLLRLDAVRGAREYRRRVTKRVLALQDAVDALEQRPAASVDVAAEEAMAAEAKTTTTVDSAEQGAVVADLPASEENHSEMEDKMAAWMEVNAAVEETEPAADEMEPTLNGANLGVAKTADKAMEDEWEMVAEEPAAAVQAALDAPRPQEPAREETTTRPAEADGGSVGIQKLMEMVAAMCEQSAQQCAVIGALAERVDALERAVRRVEDAERRRRRAKKLRKEGKGSNNHSKCYSD